jgi:hypothetical protein
VVEFRQCFEVDLHGDTLAPHLELTGQLENLDGVENIYATSTYTYEGSHDKTGNLVTNGTVTSGLQLDDVDADNPANRVLYVDVTTYVQLGGGTRRYWSFPWLKDAGYGALEANEQPYTGPDGHAWYRGSSTENGAEMTASPVTLTATQWRQP